MEKTVNDFIKELQNLRPEIKDKPIFIQAPNGLSFEPQLRFVLKEPLDFSTVKEVYIDIE